VTLFGSRVKNALVTDRDSEYVLRNEAEATTTSGVELNTSYRTGGLWIVGSYAHVRAREGSGAARAASPLVPRHSFGAEAMWEVEGRGRLGLELYYTGEQRLEANPFAEASEPYWIFGILAERRFGRARVFINGENLTDTRQTKMQPLLRPSRAADGRWTVDAWAPLEGRTINGGVRIGF
jgi:iron complex outermembrane receptor protein